MTGPLERPSQGAPENRKAAEQRSHQRDAGRAARRAVHSIHAAERELQRATHMAERRQVIAAVDGSLQALHASRIAAVIARFAGRRAAVADLADPAARAAALRQLAAEEASELARLALEHAAEKRQARKAALGTLNSAHRAARRTREQRQRREKAGVAIQLRGFRSQSGQARARVPGKSRASISRRTLPGLPNARH
ncbi:MAG: hypothetical protein ACKVOB_12350 [Sphingomonas sp.]